MLQLKDGVILEGNRYTNAILTAVQMVYDLKGWPVVVTSGKDSHDTGYHPQGRALDIRCLMIPEEKREQIANDLRNQLPLFYDVIYEPAEFKDGKVIKGPHFHLEADARKEQARGIA